MIPTVGFVMIRHPGWVIPLPLPIFLAWPFVVVAWGLVTVADRLVRRGGAGSPSLSMARVGLQAMFHLSGLEVDVRSTEETRILVRLI